MAAETSPKASDKLTQLQDCFDQLAAQMFISLHHIRSAKPSAPIPTQPDYINPPPPPTAAAAAAAATAAAAAPNAGANHANTTADLTSPPPSATTPRHPHNAAMAQAQAQATLTADMRELSSDLLKRYQQIEFIIKTLPGLGESQRAQEERIQELNEQLRVVDAELVLAAEERERLVERVDGVIVRIRRP